MTPNKYRFSVFTATFNRANLLPRVYESLVQQTLKDFEWIIVDDGSNDNTTEVVNQFISENKLRAIQYVKKENGGKHTAWRVATDFFKADYVIAIDSDDTLLPQALEIFDRYWKDLENHPDYNDFWEVKGRAQYENGSMVGKPLPAKIFDSDYDEISFKYKNKAEMQGCRKTSVLKKEAKVPEDFIFKEYCSCLAESIRWSRAARIYRTRFFDEIVRVYYFDSKDQISTSNKNQRTLKRTYNNLIAAKYTLDERRDLMLKWDKISYLKTLAVILYTSIHLSKNPLKIPSHSYISDNIIMILSYLPIWIVYKIRG